MILLIRNLLFRDFWLKVFSLVLAILIWLTVWLFFIRKDVPPPGVLSSVRLENRTFANLPVLVIAPATEPRGFQVNPRAVTVTIRGEPLKLQALEQKLQADPQARELRALVDLTGSEPARSRRKIVVTTPADMTCERVEPEEVEVLEATKP
jgi:YbbR domain-containing protein